MFPLLLHIAVFMQLSTAPVDQVSIELETRRRESGLLHMALDKTALRTLSVWEPQTDALRDIRPGEAADDGSPVLILHLWATWCVPCKEELPLWGAVGQHLTARHKGSVRIVHVALQNDSTDMASFVSQIQGKLPAPIRYVDRNEVLKARLRQAFGNNQPPLPLTLVLDSGRVVRQAFLGSIYDRRQELVDSTARLLRLIREQDAARPPLAVTPQAPSLIRPRISPQMEASDDAKQAEPNLPQDVEKQIRRAELVGPKVMQQEVADQPDEHIIPFKIISQNTRGEVANLPTTREEVVKPAHSVSKRPRWRLVVGALSVSAGIVLVGFGASALAVQGNCAADPMALRQTCDYYYATNVIGGSFVGLGGALTAGGLVLMAVPGR